MASSGIEELKGLEFIEKEVERNMGKNIYTNIIVI